MSATENLSVDSIKIADRLRELDMDSVERIAESINEIGLRTPITVRVVGKDNVLVAGAHRLEAVKRLGWTRIEAFVIENWNELEARRWEIAENLHRADLTVLERAEQEDEYVRITLELNSRQVAENAERDNRPVGRPKDETREAARQIGVDETRAKRNKRIVGLTPEAKKVARAEGLDTNQRALLAASRAEPGKQAELLRNWRKDERPAAVRLPPVITKAEPPDMYVVAHQLAAKYSVIELTQLIDHLGDLIKEREAA